MTSLVCGCRAGEGGAGLDAHHVLLNQTLGNLRGLPAAGTALVQRIVSVTQLFNDMLQTAACHFRGGIGMGSQHQSAVYGKAGRASVSGPDFGLDRKSDV